jgi:hypothetical protein
MATFTIKRELSRTAYAKNGNTQNPTKSYNWRCFVDGVFVGQYAKLGTAKDFLRDYYSAAEISVERAA